MVARGLFPTPTTHDAKGAGPSQLERNSLGLSSVARLDPSWVPCPCCPGSGEFRCQERGQPSGQVLIEQEAHAAGLAS